MSEKIKGVLAPKQEEFCAEVMDFWFKFKNPIVEKFDKMAFKFIIQGADNIGADKLPEAWKADLIPIITAGMEKRAEDVRVLMVDLLNKKIDFKHLDDAQELMVFDAFSRFLVTAIDFFVQKQKAA